MKNLKDKRGFTLLELIIVVIILGIMASLAIPRVNGLIERSRSRAAINMLGSIYSSEQRFAQETNVYTNVPANLDINPVPNVANFGNPPTFVGGPPPTSLYYERNAGAGSVYRIHIDLAGVDSGRIRCSDTVPTFGAAPCPTIGFTAAGDLIQ